MAGLGFTQALAFAVEHELDIINESHAVGLGELLSAGADKVDMRRFLQHETRGLDGVAQALDAGDAAGFHAASVHEQGVKLNAAVGCEEAAAAGVEGGVVFKNGDGCFNGVDGRAADGEDGIAGFQGAAYAEFMGGCGVGGNGPCAAVDEECGIVRGRRC